MVLQKGYRLDKNEYYCDTHQQDQTKHNTQQQIW